MTPLQQLREIYRSLVSDRGVAANDSGHPIASEATEYQLKCPGPNGDPMSIDVRQTSGANSLGIHVIFKNAPDFAVTAIQTDLHDALRRVSGDYQTRPGDRSFIIEAPAHAAGAEAISNALVAIKGDLTEQERFGEKYWQALGSCDITPEPISGVKPIALPPKVELRDDSFQRMIAKQKEDRSNGHERAIDVTEASLRNVIEEVVIFGPVAEIAKAAFANLTGNEAEEGEGQRMVKANSSQIADALGPVLFEKYGDAEKVNGMLQEIQASLKPELKV